MTKHQDSQGGTTLLIGLLILLAITLLTLVSARASLSQNKALQASLEFRQVFAAADSALNTVEQDLLQQLQLIPCASSCEEINGIRSSSEIDTDFSRKSDQWWQASATAWQGGWRLTFLQSTERITQYDEVSGVWTEFQRELYSSYFYQPGLLPGNRVLLRSIWLVDRQLNSSQIAEGCVQTNAVRRAWQENILGICGRLAWEQLLP